MGIYWGEPHNSDLNSEFSYVWQSQEEINFKLLGGESESAFLLSLWSVRIVKLKVLHNESSRAVHNK